MIMSDDELIEQFWISFGNKPHMKEDLWFYSSEWSMLMPLIELVESIHDDFHGYFGVHISSNNCTIQGTNLRTDPENFHPAYFADHYAESKLQATYNAIVEFIKWYKQR